MKESGRRDLYVRPILFDMEQSADPWYLPRGLVRSNLLDQGGIPPEDFRSQNTRLRGVVKNREYVVGEVVERPEFQSIVNVGTVKDIHKILL
jgi:hypothetical protein